MRKIRKIIQPAKPVHIIKETNSAIVEKNYQKNTISKISIKTERTPNIQTTKDRRFSRVNTAKPHLYNVEPIWKGETVYVIGGGPSLIDFNWNSLIGKRTIVINKSILSYPGADVVYWTDSRVYGWYKNEINEFKGLKITIRNHASYSADIKVLKKGCKFGLEESKDSLCHGNNSGYAAINLAYLLGAKQIILLGYDMKNDGKQSHYHDGYPVPATGNNVYKDQFIPGFEILAGLLKDKNVKVYNASINSDLLVWPKISFEKALSLR
jgi:hypothetical protein